MSSNDTLNKQLNLILETMRNNHKDLIELLRGKPNLSTSGVSHSDGGATDSENDESFSILVNDLERQRLEKLLDDLKKSIGVNSHIVNSLIECVSRKTDQRHWKPLLDYIESCSKEGVPCDIDEVDRLLQNLLGGCCEAKKRRRSSQGTTSQSSSEKSRESSGKLSATSILEQRISSQRHSKESARQSLSKKNDCQYRGCESSEKTSKCSASSTKVETGSGRENTRSMADEDQRNQKLAYLHDLATDRYGMLNSCIKQWNTVVKLLKENANQQQQWLTQFSSVLGDINWDGYSSGRTSGDKAVEQRCSEDDSLKSFRMFTENLVKELKKNSQLSDILESIKEEIDERASIATDYEESEEKTDIDEGTKSSQGSSDCSSTTDNSMKDMREDHIKLEEGDEPIEVRRSRKQVQEKHEEESQTDEWLTAIQHSSETQDRLENLGELVNNFLCALSTKSNHLKPQSNSEQECYSNIAKEETKQEEIDEEEAEPFWKTAEDQTPAEENKSQLSFADDRINNALTSLVNEAATTNDDVGCVKKELSQLKEEVSKLKAMDSSAIGSLKVISKTLKLHISTTDKSNHKSNEMAGQLEIVKDRSSFLEVKTTPSGSLVITWPPAETTKSRSVIGYLIFIDGQLHQKVRNEARTSAVISADNLKKEIIVVAEIENGVPLLIATHSPNG